MILTETATATTIDTSATFTCSQCPFARQIEDNRYCCQVSQTASDVKRGHWEATISCFEALAKAEAETEKTETAAEVKAAPIAQTPAPATPAPATTTPTAPSAIGQNGDEPIAPKKLNLSLVAVKRISSDIPASNFDQFELEVLGELSLAIGGFLVPPVLVRDSSGYKVVAGHLQYHAAVLARQLNPKAGETIPVILLESENESAALAQLKMLRFAA